MATNTQMAKVAEIIEKAPLKEVLETVECVAEFIPVAGPVVKTIIKVLRILVKVQPSVEKTIHSITDLQQLTPEELNKYASFIPALDNANLNVLRTMVDIALEDGMLTDDEIDMLTRKAIDCGIDKDLFEIGIRNELNKL